MLYKVSAPMCKDLGLGRIICVVYIVLATMYMDLGLGAPSFDDFRASVGGFGAFGACFTRF